MNERWMCWITPMLLVATTSAQGGVPVPITYPGQTAWPSGFSAHGTFTKQVAADFAGNVRWRARTRVHAAENA